MRRATDGAQQRQRDADDRVIIARHTLDKGAAQPVHREGPRHVQGLAGSDVRVDLGIRDIPEVNLGRGRAGHSRGDRAFAPRSIVGRGRGKDRRRVARPEGGGCPAHGADALTGHVGSVGLAEHLAVDLEHGVAADDEDGLALGQFGVGAGRSQGLADIGALGCGERRDFVRRGGRTSRECAPAGQCSEDGVLVDGGNLDDRCDARRNERCAACGGS